MPGRPKTARRQKIRASLPQHCAACDATEALTLDHIVPRVYGGGNERENFQLLCPTCHVEKSKREVRHRHPAANQRAGDRLRIKLEAAQIEAALALVALFGAFNYYNSAGPT